MSRRPEQLKVRQNRVRGPKGEWLHPILFLILDRDEKGRPKNARIYYDDDDVELGQIAEERGSRKIEFHIVFMPGAQMHATKPLVTHDILVADPKPETKKGGEGT